MAHAAIFAINVYTEFYNTRARQTRRPARCLRPVVVDAFQLETPQTCYSRLEARVVVEGHLVVHVLLALVHIMIILVRPANKSALQ